MFGIPVLTGPWSCPDCCGGIDFSSDDDTATATATISDPTPIIFAVKVLANSSGACERVFLLLLPLELKILSADSVDPGRC
jgi:hypothetical protein